MSEMRVITRQKQDRDTFEKRDVKIKIKKKRKERESFFELLNERITNVKMFVSISIQIVWNLEKIETTCSQPEIEIL